QMPLLLNNVGLNKALLVALDETWSPNYRATTVSWSSPDGKQVEAFTRMPYAADNPQTYFHLAHYLHKTIMQHHLATIALAHRETPAPPWYQDWLELCRLGPVLGKWTTLTHYLEEVHADDYGGGDAAEEYRGDHLTERTNAHLEQPVSEFAWRMRQR